MTPVKRRKDSDGGAVPKSSHALPHVNGKAEPPVLQATSRMKAAADMVLPDGAADGEFWYWLPPVIWPLENSSSAELMVPAGDVVYLAEKVK